MQRRFQAGSISAIYDSHCGDLRDIRFHGELVCLRIYAAVRDENWGTVSGFISDEHLEETTDTFTIRFTSTHRQGAIDFSWQGTIRGSSKGAIFFSFDGEAHANFRRNRIGFCVLHPMQAAGLPCTLNCTDGMPLSATLPSAINPDQPPEGFTDLIGLTHSLPQGGEVEFTFIGDAFEMEDQRNWTDASFKTFCTPLSLPFPVEVHKGEQVQQSITMRYIPPKEPFRVSPGYPSRVSGGQGGMRLAESRGAENAITLTLLDTPPNPFPTIGLGVPRELPMPDETDLAQLKTLGLSHLRVDDFDPNGLALAGALGLPVELVLHGTEYSAMPGNWVRVLALPDTENPNQVPDHAALLEAARAAFPSIPIFLGTDADFLFLNRFTPPSEPPRTGGQGGTREAGVNGDGLTFAITPQVHAFDNASIIETAAAQGVVLANARRLAERNPVIVSPVTLLPRWNPYAAAPQPRNAVPLADPRQGTPFCAAWTLASLKYLAQAGAASITYYETHGPGGVLGTPTENLLLRVVGARKVLPSWSSDPLRVEVLALEKPGERIVLAANLTPAPQEVWWQEEKRTLEPYAVVNL